MEMVGVGEQNIDGCFRFALADKVRIVERQAKARYVLYKLQGLLGRGNDAADMRFDAERKPRLFSFFDTPDVLFYAAIIARISWTFSFVPLDICLRTWLGAI